MAEARGVLEPFHEDLRLVYSPDDELAVEVAEPLALFRLDLDDPPLAR